MRIFFPTRKAALKNLRATSCRSFHACRKGRIIGTTSGATLIMSERTSDGRPIRIVTILDEQSHECLEVRVHPQVKAAVICELPEVFVEHGAPDDLPSADGPEFTADVARQWLGRLGVKTAFIEPGSPWENGDLESLNGGMGDEPLNGGIFDTLLEARVMREQRRSTHNTVRPHSSFGCRPPAPQVRIRVSLPMAGQVY